MRGSEGSTLVGHVACPACSSSDGCATYDDGHSYCFVCGAYSQSTEGGPRVSSTPKQRSGLIYELEYSALPKRGITEETARHFGYGMGEYNGKPVQVAPYYGVDGQLVAQKLRFQNKDFVFLGDQSEALPFGAQAFPKGGKKVVVTEGEIDCLTMSQVQGNKWPVVSIASGAGPQIKKYVARIMPYLEGFEEVVLMFDMDEPGRAAAKVAAEIIGKRARVADLPLKDPNEMLLAGRSKELIEAMWRAQPYRPEGIVEMSALKESVKEPPKPGLSLPWPRLTALLYGIPERAIVTIGGAGGGGKTDFLAEIIQHLTTAHREAVGVFSLEQAVTETATRIAGKYARKPFHVPDGGWTDADKDAAWDALMAGGKVFLYDSFGVNEWDAIRAKIEYLRHAEGVRYFFVDNLTALAAAEESEKEGIERIMADMGSLVQKLDITLFVVSHLATPEGKSHEEGGRVMGKHFKGSRSIIFWSYVMIGLERNQQADDPVEQRTTTVRILKERKTGRGLGKTFALLYDPDTGMQNETDAKQPTTGSPKGGPSDF